MRAIVYARVSTDAQERDGTSLDTQERACLLFAREQGWRVVEAIRDTASGFSLDRPGIDSLRHLLRAGAVDVVVAYAVDRLSRNQNQIGVLFDEIQQAGARLEFVTERFEDTAVGRFILAARAFIAEVEREKIVERTTRGKLARARSGRIPQATGSGCYGYTYNSATGQREIEPVQAVTVRRIFQRYTEIRSMSAVTRELNADGYPSFSGGRWSRQVVQGILTNESYIGRFVYGRTRIEKTRPGIRGKGRRTVQRPADDWIVVDGASPAIIDRPLWERVPAILSDPERTRHLPQTQFYELRGHGRCGACGGALTGQSITSKGRRYRYYRCRLAYTKETDRPCSMPYIRADHLEATIWKEVRRILADPEIVLSELERQHDAEDDREAARQIEAEIERVREREKRLVRLFTYGEIDEVLVREEGAQLRRRRQCFEDQLALARPRPVPLAAGVDHDVLTATCNAVRDWLDRADADARRLTLEALQIGVAATSKEVSVSGVIPMEQPEFLTSAPSR